MPTTHQYRFEKYGKTREQNTIKPERGERETKKKKNDKKKKRKGNKFQLKLEVNWAFVAKHGPIIT